MGDGLSGSPNKVLCSSTVNTKKGELVAAEIISIYSMLGAPSVLQLDNGREFVNNPGIHLSIFVLLIA